MSDPMNRIENGGLWTTQYKHTNSYSTEHGRWIILDELRDPLIMQLYYLI